MLIKGYIKSRTRYFLLFLFITSIQCLQAEHFDTPVISIIIDDLGYRGTDDLNALSLPGPITYAIMPHAPNSLKISEIAKQSGNNVILHLPMEAIEKSKNKYLGPGALKIDMSENIFISTLSNNIHSIPNIIGVNNHMGSLLTNQIEQMEWLMDYLYLRKIFYVDSLTSSSTVTREIANKKNVPYLERDVFLDNYRDTEYIDSQFKLLISVAKRKGSAIAIGHPHPETIKVLKLNLQKIETFGVKLISLKDMIEDRHPNINSKLTLLK
ncbi:MAG: divergent polysaccharide deacetylase family protein [Gammaproteobacteria bacterium]|jgi:polysaccharide deacetylase 2 family uncharacterized protein YibQ